jgi:O-antigen/teichoic acid export membrane protein
MQNGQGASQSDLIAKAGFWVVAGKLTARSIDFCCLLILARLLSPADFGLVALAMVTILIIEVVLELPLTQAMVRIPALTEPVFATAFTLGAMRGVVLASLLGCVAWPLSLFYQEPRLVELIWILALAPILRGLVSPRMVIFMKKFDFRREFALDVIGKISALLVATGVALGTGSYWAIAAATVTTPLVSLVLSYAFAPLRPRLTLSQWSLFSDMISWNTAAQLISALNWQLDKLLLGGLADLASFGRYSVADNLSGIPQQALVQPLTRPMMAGFATITSPAVYAVAYCKATNAIFSATAPILVCLAMLSDPIIRILLDEKWIEAAPMLQWLALSYLLSVPTEAMPPLAMAMNRTRFVAVRMIAEFVVKLPALIIGIVFWGLTGALIARCVATAAVLISVALIVRHLIGVSFKQLTQALWRPAMACTAMAIFLLFIAPLGHNHDSTWLLMLETTAAGMAAVAVYGAMLLFSWMASNRPDGIESIVVGHINRMLVSMRLRTT